MRALPETGKQLSIVQSRDHDHIGSLRTTFCYKVSIGRLSSCRSEWPLLFIKEIGQQGKGQPSPTYHFIFVSQNCDCFPLIV